MFYGFRQLAWWSILLLGTPQAPWSMPSCITAASPQSLWNPSQWPMTHQVVIISSASHKCMLCLRLLVLDQQHLLVHLAWYSEGIMRLSRG